MVLGDHHGNSAAVGMADEVDRTKVERVKQGHKISNVTLVAIRAACPGIRVVISRL